MIQHRDEKFMEAALAEAGDALADGEFPVGCVIAEGDEVIATGSRKNSSAEFCEMDHAEIMALRNLQGKRPEVDMTGITVYSTMEPCLMCFSTLIVNNVTRIVYGYEDAMGGGTNLPLHLLSPLYKEYQIEIVRHVLRNDCLRLFQKFFSNPQNDYLKDTLLAEYTLSQESTSL